MAGLPTYVSESDLITLLSHLNASEEIAFIVSKRPSKWIAVNTLEALTNGRYCLWHVPSGPGRGRERKAEAKGVSRKAAKDAKEILRSVFAAMIGSTLKAWAPFQVS